MDEIEKFLEDAFNIKNITKYHFKTLCGFTFVFKSKIMTFNDNISSASIKPEGIIFKENGEYLFAPLDRTYEINEIIKEYVKRKII
ncbi:hypothetical protein [Methanobrevibacter sp.]|uniref:hypothetical protein n=1 Tax=Methanobrevibacter sp. TaxID=66852 RepID=UPI00388D3D43